MNDSAAECVADGGADEAHVPSRNGPKPMARPCPISRLLSRLNQESTARALQHRREGRSARWHHFAAFPLQVMRRYLAQWPPQLGLIAFALAAFRAFGTFMTWAKVWEAEQCGNECQPTSDGTGSSGWS